MKPLLLLGAALVCAAAGPTAHAQRDPLEPPPAQRAARSAAEPGAAPPVPDPVVRHLVTVDGQRWLLDGARRFGVGDRLGTLRIECIHDQGVTVRDSAGRQRELPIHGALHIRAAGATSPTRSPCPATPSAAATPKRSLP